jgi:hypothetical protein
MGCDVGERDVVHPIDEELRIEPRLFDARSVPFAIRECEADVLCLSGRMEERLGALHEWGGGDECAAPLQAGLSALERTRRITEGRCSRHHSSDAEMAVAVVKEFERGAFGLRPGIGDHEQRLILGDYLADDVGELTEGGHA